MQISTKLRQCDAGYAHWCPGCRMLHILPTGCGWTYRGPFECLSASPSFLNRRKRSTGEDRTCHYILTGGILNFCGDCWHDLKGQSVPLPDLPEDYHDFESPVHSEAHP